MRTALYAFGDLRPPVPWQLEPEAVEVPDFAANIPVPQKGADLLRQLQRQDLLELYLQLPQGWEHRLSSEAQNASATVARFQRLTERLLARPEQRIILVTHGHFQLRSLGYLPRNGEVVPYALLPSGEWRSLLPPECLTRGR